MSFKRSWSRRLAAILSAVMVVSAALPVSVPAMEVQADDMLSVADEGTLNAQEEDAPAITDEEPLSLTEDETLNVPEDDLVDDMANGSLTEEQAEGTELTDVDDPVIHNPDMADDTYSGKLVLDTVSEGIIKKIAYKFDDGVWNEVDVTQDGPKTPIDFTGIKKITFKAPGAPDDGKTIPLYDNENTDGYQIRFSPNDGRTKPQFIEQSHKELSFELKDTAFVQNGTFTMYINTLINRYDRKKGNLIIRVASENKIPGTDKIISINEVKVQLGDHAIAYDVSGNIVTGNYRQYAVAPFVEVSQNNIGTAGYGGTITIPYWCAKDATISINDTSAYSGNDEKGTRYAYTIGDGFFYSEQANISDPSKKKYTVDLAEEIGTDTHVTIGVRQMSFDPEVKFSTVSNRIMTKFIVTADDGVGNTAPYEIDALSDDVIKTQVFEKARKLVFDYDGFTVKDTASAEYKRDSGNDANWVYRIDYKDTEGNDVSKSLYDIPEHKTFVINIDDNGRFPTEIKVSAIPNVKVTLSANGVRQYKRNIGDIFDEIVWEAEGKGVVTNSVTGGKYSFWVEPNRIVSINKLCGAKGYIFPYVEEASTVYRGVDRCLQFTLPEITQDREFSVSFYEFDLDNRDLFTVTNGIRNDDGQPGKASVSINGLGGSYVGTDTDSLSQLKDHKVLIAQLNGAYKYEQLEVNIKMDSAEALEYAFDRISYAYYDYDGDGDKPVEAHRSKNLIPGDTSTDYKIYYDCNFKVTQDSHGNYIATVYIPTRWVVFKLIKDGRFDITVTEHENKRKSSITLTEGTSGTIETASVKLGDEYRYALNRPGYSASGTLPYGSDIFLKAEPADGYGLVSVDIICPSNSDNNETITDEKKLAAFLGDEGYKYKLREGVSVRFNTEPVYCATVRYKTGSDEPGLHSGKYSIDHKRPVLVQYRKGNTSPAGYNCDIYVGSEKITSNEGINKTGDVYTVDANSGGLAGKNVTFKFYMGDGSKTDSSLRTLVLAFDKADTGVKFGSDKYSVPLGAEKDIPVSITGSFEASAVLASDKTYDKTGLTYRLDTSKKRFIFSSTNDSKADTYTINIVNPNDKNVVYGSVKVELETTTVKAVPAPVVQIIGTTNRGVTVGLKAQKIDTKIKGLCYELQVKTKDQKKGYFKTSRGVEAGDKIYIPVTTSSIYVDMFTDSAASASQYAGDPDALFVATARLIQLRSDNKTVVIGSDNWSDEKNGTFSTKEGARYETKLRLKKISKGTIYNTMSSGNAYRIGVVYSKKTAIQRLDRTKLQLLTGSGEEVNYPVGKSIEDYLEIGDDYTILFHPGGMESIKYKSYPVTELKCLPVGTYIIRAYALEPDSVEVSASIKVKVERGANSINLKNVSNIIYKQPGKAVSLQIKAPVMAESHIATSGATVFVEFVTPKMKYEIIDEKNTGGFVKISKSGKITINKKLVPDNTEFKVRVTADDFTRNPGTEEIVEEKTIKVRSNSDLDGLTLAYIPDYDIGSGEGFDPAEGKLNRLGNSYYLNELTSYTLDQDKFCWTYEPRFWITVFERNRNEGKNSFVPVDFKISGAGRLLETRSTEKHDSDGTYGTCAGIEITDIDKDIMITAYAKDGSGRKIKNYKVRVKSANGKLGVFISDGQISNDDYDKLNVLDRAYGKTDLTFDSYAMEKDGMNMIIDSEFYDEKTLGTKSSAVRYKISSIKGGRITKVHFWQNRIYPTASRTTFTITDLTNKKDYNVTINNKGYVDRSKKTKVTMTNTIYDAGKGKKTVNGVIYSHLDFSSTDNYTDYNSVKWNTVKFHVDSAEDNQYVMVRIVSSVKRVGGEYKVATKPLGDCFFKLMDEQSTQETEKGRDKIERDGAAYPIKLTGKDFSIDFYDRSTKKFEMVPGSYKLVITPVRREGYFKYQTLANPATVTLKVVTPPKANVNPGTSIEFGTSEGTVTKGKYSNFLTSPVYTEQGILYKELKDVNMDGKMNGFRKNFNITDNKTGKIKYIGTDPIGMKDKDRNAKLQGWLIIEYQQVDGTVVEKPVKVKVVSKGEIKK